MSTLPLLDTQAPLPVRCRGCRRVCRNGTTQGYGPKCARELGLLPPRQHRFGAASGAADATLFDINEGEPVDPDAPAALDALRRQVTALLSQIDTATLPLPDRVRPRQDDYPGPEWLALKGWRIFTIDNPDSAGFVYIDHDCDAESLAYRWDGPGNWESLRIEEARRIGLALLAAAARADEQFVGVSRLDDRRVARVSKEPT